jgi:4-hydroxyphenylpyruvate dioxygenase
MSTSLPTVTAARPSVADQVLGWDHVEWWVGNARAFTAWLCGGFGFEVVALSGPETGQAGCASYLLRQGAIRFVVTAGLSPESEVARHVLLHGDGVHSLAWSVADPALALETAQRNGAEVVAEPVTLQGEGGSLTTAAIRAYGETNITFIDRSNWQGTWGPSFSAERLPASFEGPPVGLGYIDHVVGNVEEGRLDEWVAWFKDVLGFEEFVHFSAEQISTRYSALRSTVVRNKSGVVLPVNEPAAGLKKSQITEYLEAYRGPGVQHIALGTRDILNAVGAMRRRSVRFLDMPPSYYEDVRRRFADLDLAWDELENLGVEVDKESGGYLLQIFTETLADRPTFFMEVIQREGATGFGEGNFKALFEALEREQDRRHNL